MLNHEHRDWPAKGSRERRAAKNDEIDRLRSALRAIVNHWDEFGPECGFAEIIDRVARPAI